MPPSVGILRHVAVQPAKGNYWAFSKMGVVGMGHYWALLGHYWAFSKMGVVGMGHYWGIK
ncbi:hypothetical protein HanPSC8_Chr03g0132461 [Helianthus annuus]|nr:hypothetical protein HanPSC8_Chr03g0132461 [Helianthus annuus]